MERFVLIAAFGIAGYSLCAQNVEFRESSEPTGLVNRVSYPELGARASTSLAPDTSLGYRFTHWTVEETRISDFTGRAANPATFTALGPCSAIAHYLPENQDTDTDGLVDAFEIGYFGNLGQAQASDPDADGFDIATELLRGQHPRVPDEIVPGGISRRRDAALFVVGPGVGDATAFYGGISRRRSDTTMVVLNPAYAYLEEKSDPAGLVAASRIVRNGSTVLLSTAPDPSNGYRYTGWFGGGIRLDRPTQKQPIPITISGHTTATARYVAETADTDGDGVADWLEWFHFDSLAHGPADDPDGDGLPTSFEIFRGYVPSNSDDLGAGGISRRRSVTAHIDLSGNVTCRMVSVPPGIVDQTTCVRPGLTITTPDLKTSTYSTYRFAYWDLDGVRQTDLAGVSLTQFSFTSSTAARLTATAHYAEGSADDDFDGVPDWFELVSFGTTGRGAGDDSDGDGMTLGGEYLRGYSPRVRDTLAAGGVSRRRSLLTAVNTVQLTMPPDVTINAATWVTPDSAQLNAWVNPRGLETTTYFEYGRTTAYGDQTPVQTLTGALGPVPVFAPVSGLAAATVYHFRVVATNAIGHTITPDATFSTRWNATSAEGFEDGSASSRWQITGDGWQVGVPTNGPGAAHEGAACAGTGLQADYLPNTDSRLISPLFAVPALDETPQLRFSHWWSFAAGDFGTVEVREGTTGAWQALATYGGPVREWMETALDLSAFAGRNAQVAFRLQSNADADVAAGWFVDGVEVVTGQLELWTGTPAEAFATETFWATWTVMGYGWECGLPSSGPGSAFEGDTCAATTLAGNYQDNTDTRLASRFFLVPESGQNPRLRFWQWYSFGSGDWGGIDVRRLGGSWEPLDTYTGGGGTGWSKPAVDLSAYAGATVQVAFRLVSNGSAAAPGWYVDAVQLVTGPEVLNNPETFDGDMGDWYLDLAGIWQIGRPTSGPGSAHSGSNVAATVLGGSYPPNSSALLQSPAFVVGDAGLGRLMALSFWSWHQYGSGDSGQVQVSRLSGDVWSAWVPVLTVTGNSAGWQQESVNLTAYRGKTIRLGFQHTANGDGSTGAGWYLDGIEISSLVLGGLAEAAPVTNVLSGNGVRHYYTLTVTTAGPLSLDLGVVGTGATAGVYLRRGSLPTLGEFDYRAATPGTGSQSVLIPFLSPGTYYVMVHAPDVQAPSEYTLTATPVRLAVQSVAPTRADARQAARLALTGAGFLPGVTVELLGAGGVSRFAPNVEILSLSSLRADFPANTIAAGGYSVRVTVPDQPAVALADAVEFTSAGKGRLAANLIVPSSVGRNTPATIYIQYRNEGDAPMAAPLFTLTASGQSLLTLDQQSLASGLWTVSTPRGFGYTVPFYVGDDTLEPGESGSIPVYFAGLRDASATEVRFELRALLPDNDAAADWASRKHELRPATISADAWDVLYANFMSMAGTTWGHYSAMLAESRRYRRETGGSSEDRRLYYQAEYSDVASVVQPSSSLYLMRRPPVMKPIDDSGELLAHRFLIANGVCPIRTLASGVDASMPAPGVPLVLVRTFPQGIAERFALGPFGRGWFHGWQMKAEAQSDGAIEVVGPGTARRRFEPDTRRPGQFSTVGKGDYGTFRLQGGTYRLQEKDGTLYVFRGDGLLGYVEDLNGNRITLLYTGGNLTSLTHSNGASLTLAYHGTGQIRSVTDSLGRATTYDYDASEEHLATVTEHDGRVTRYAYDSAAGSPARHALTAVTSPDGAVRNFGYDGRGWLVSTSRNGGSEPVTFAYDSLGKVTSTDVLGKTTTFSFDDRGLLVKVVNPLGHTVRMVFDRNFNLVSVADPVGKNHSYGYDPKGNMAYSVDPIGALTRFTYTADWSRLASVTDANGNPTRYDYDTKGNLAAITYADSSREDWDYDAAGNAAAWVNRRGAEVGFTYDAAGRVTRKSYANGTEISYAYDARGNLDQTVDPHGTTDLDYDAKDRLIQITYPGDRWLRFAYDAAGRRTNSVDQLGHTLHYYYDALGRLSHMQDETGTEIVRYQYDLVGRMSRKTLGNGVYTTYEYDAAGQLLHLVNLKPDAAVLSRFDYAYDSRGRRTVMETHYGTWTYGYDDIGQLTRAVLVSTDTNVPSQDLTYVYDKLGNRTKTIENGLTKDYTVNHLNQYTKVGDTAYVFDKDGNLIEERAPEGTTRYTYNDENRLVGITSGLREWSYVYDAFGNRVSANENGSVTHVVIDPAGLGNSVGQYAANGQFAVRYDHGLTLLNRRDEAGSISYYTADAIGSVSEGTTADSALENSYMYRPFGEVLGRVSQLSNPYQFVGQWGATYVDKNVSSMRMRYYHSSIGRFMSEDPLGLVAGDVNAYRYVGNRSVEAIDPTGERIRFDWIPESERQRRHKDGSVSIVQGDYNWATDTLRINPDYVRPFVLAHELWHAIQDHWQNLWNPGFDVRDFIRNNRDRIEQDASVVGMNIALLTQDFDGFTAQLDYWLQHDSAAGTPIASTTVPVWVARDPNDCIGPAGYGPSNYVAAGALLPYRIRFENHTNAAAPAQAVVITDQLSADLDGSTFRVTAIGFGDQIISVPANTQEFEKQHACTVNGHDILVDIWAGFDPATGEAFCRLYTLNPTTGLPPTVDIGMLPPEDGSGRGQGWFCFTVRPQATLATGTEIRNIARIKFDANAWIATNQVDPHNAGAGTDPAKEALVTIDADAPVSAVAGLAAVQGTGEFAVCWSGTDAGAGIASYTVYVQQDGGPFSTWLTDTALTETTYSGTPEHTYGFYSIATDGVGHQEPAKTAAEATTTVGYTVTFAAGEHGSLTGTAEQAVPPGGDASPVTAVSDLGYHFVHWLRNGTPYSTDNPLTVTAVEEGMALTAAFAINQYTLTYLAEAGGSIAGPTPQAVEHGGDGIPVTAEPADCYHFVRWHDGSTANPRQDSALVADLTVTAEFAVDPYTLTYMAGANGSLLGPSPQTVLCGNDGARVTAVPAFGYGFVRWSDGSTANPRTDRDVTTGLTVAAEFAVSIYGITFVAGPNGSILGAATQQVAHGGSATPVTAVPAAGYVFREWSDGSPASPRTLMDVTEDRTLTALFRAANPVAPEGSFQAVVDAADAASGRGWWDLTGAYTTPVAGHPLALNMVHDTTGRLSGTATYAVGTTVVSMPIRGSVKGSSGSITMAGTLKGTDSAKTVSVALTLDLTVDTVNRQLTGTMAGGIRIGATADPVSTRVTLPIPAPMDGTWTLRLQLGQAGRAVAGTALLTLSNGVERAFVVQGRTHGADVVLSLVGNPADPASKAIRIRTTITPLEGAWTRLQSLSAEGYGQSVRW